MSLEWCTALGQTILAIIQKIAGLPNFNLFNLSLNSKENDLDFALDHVQVLSRFFDKLRKQFVLLH